MSTDNKIMFTTQTITQSLNCKTKGCRTGYIELH